jgi:membrane-associated phospholipid phosphatase
VNGVGTAVREREAVVRNMKTGEHTYAAGAFGANPAWYFVAGCFSILALIAFLNRERFPFGELNFFTFLWTLAALLIVHTGVNARHYLALRGSGGDLPGAYLGDILGYVPYLLVAALYDNVSLFERAVTVKVRDLDLILMKMDGIIFGVQPTIFMERWLHPFLVEYSMAAYSLFLLPFLFLLYLFRKGEREAFDITILAQVIVATIAVISFIFLPAEGPRHLFDPANDGRDVSLPKYSRPLEGVRIDALERATGRESLFRAQYDGWNMLERVKTDCMPSMHTALYLICLIAVIRFRRMMKWRRAALVFWSVSCASLVFSCVYLRYHWFVDVLAGAALAWLSFFIADSLIRRRSAACRSSSELETADAGVSS